VITILTLKSGKVKSILNHPPLLASEVGNGHHHYILPGLPLSLNSQSYLCAETSVFMITILLIHATLRFVHYRMRTCLLLNLSLWRTSLAEVWIIKHENFNKKKFKDCRHKTVTFRVRGLQFSFTHAQVGTILNTKSQKLNSP